MLNTYRFTLYNASQIEISTSGTMYATNIQSSYQGDTVLTPLAYTFSGLADNTTYYLKIDGLTVNGTQVTTGMVQFVVRYSTPSSFAQLTAVNNCDKGYIRLESNVVLIDGTAFPEPIYIDNEKIALTRDGSYVLFDKGYNIPNDATVQIWFESPVIDSMIVEIQNNNNEKIQLFTVTDPNNVDKFYCVLLVDNRYIITTMPVDKNKTYCVSIRRIDNLYDLFLSVIGDVEETDYLNFTSLTDNTTFGLQSTNEIIPISVEYSFDKIEWQDLPINTDISMGQSGSTVYLRGLNNTFCAEDSYYSFTFSDNVRADGSIMSLVDNTGTSTTIPSPQCFFALFRFAKIITAPKLPATTLTAGCYQYLFNQTLIEEAPYLPATTLAQNCYSFMFNGCNKLKSVKLSYTGNFSTDYFRSWITIVEPNGTFYYNGSDRTVASYAIPEGWNVVGF